MPLFSTPTQFAVLALMLVAGWFLGLASHPGGKKWRARYAAERDAHAAEREAHAATRKDADARVSAATAHHAELERENARLAQQPAPVAATAARPARVTMATRPAYPSGERRGWFDWGTTPRA
ncbi:hypothetical protein [Sphingomonas sp. CROZ-RG-20F-R02-07]|uniref:hypothetical protein n=1 Tax=Sphingomonas sp. CROZ-RG-20F-R02-07 TaxID=2914832 RepID=UPI001F5846D3|nr:hypothetical protein [Sphingomonas sp. CROZ-RG-20F-R02-07]